MTVTKLKVRLGDVTTLQNGFAFDSKKFSTTSGIPLIRIRDLRHGKTTKTNYVGDFSRDFLVTKGDLLIGLDGEFRCYRWEGEPALLNQRVCRVVPNSAEILSDYLLLVLDSHLKRIEDVTAYTTVKHLSIKDIREIEIDLPPLDAQQEIVDKALNQLSIIQELAKLATLKKSTSLALREALLGNLLSALIESYGEQTLEDAFQINRGGSPRPIKKYLSTNPEHVSWIKISDATRSGKFITETVQRITPEGIKHSRLVNVGDFLLTNSMSFGRPYIAGITGCVHDGWLVLTPRDREINVEFWYYMLSSSFLYRQFDLAAVGSTVRNLNIELVKKIKVPNVPLERQALELTNLIAIDGVLTSLEAKYENEASKVTNLRAEALAGVEAE